MATTVILQPIRQPHLQYETYMTQDGDDDNIRKSSSETDTIGTDLITATSTAATTPQDDRDFVCSYPECGKVFTKSSKFEDHKRSHTGERPFECQVEFCGKSFTRKDHLQRHSRSHLSSATGSSNINTKEEEEARARPFACTSVTESKNIPCTKRFLSKQHLVRHVREVHDITSTADEGELTSVEDGKVESKARKKRKSRKGGEGAYECEIEGCSEAFVKRKHLRSHILLRHSDIGQSLTDLDEEEAARIARLPYPCTQNGCSKRFATNSKRNAHARSHNDKTKYMCALMHKGDEGQDDVLYFATWTELQDHQRKSHPPTCNWPECDRTFANAHNLRLHIQRHEAKAKESATFHSDVDYIVDRESEDDESHQAKGLKTFDCNWTEKGKDTPLCNKVFRSKYAREVHIKNLHLGLKEFACSHKGCFKEYGNKRSLNRHLLKCIHKSEAKKEERKSDGENVGSADDEEGNMIMDDAVDDDFFRQEGGAVPESSAERGWAKKRSREERNELGSFLTSLTGRGYGNPAAAGSSSSLPSKKRKMRGRVVACPWSKICFLRDGMGEKEDGASCPFRFSRLYDVQRHLKAEHNVALLQTEISTLISKEEESQLATPRSGSNEQLEEEPEAESQKEEPEQQR